MVIGVVCMVCFGYEVCVFVGGLLRFVFYGCVYWFVVGVWVCFVLF